MSTDFLHSWSVCRALKFVALAWFLVGLGGATLSASRRSRLRATYLAVVPGFVTTYAAGWLLMKLSGRSLLTSWLLAGAIAGFGAMHLAFLASHLERPRVITRVLACASASVAIAVMSLRPSEAMGLGVVVVVALTAGSMAAWPLARSSALSSDADPQPRFAHDALRWITWLEGGSLLLMVLVAIPLREGLGFRLDGGTGLLGWVHGMLVIVFVQTLWSTRKLFDWPRTELLLGVLSALLPGGGFWFERRLRRHLVEQDS